MNKERWDKYVLDNAELEHDIGTRPEILEAQPGYIMTKFVFNGLSRTWNKNKRILDVGASDGTFMKYFIDSGFKNTEGVTLCRADAEYGIKNYGFKIKVGDMHELPYKDGEFDVIWCRQTFEHAIAPYIAMCEFNRVLKKGGKLIILMPSPQHWTIFPHHYSVLNPPQMLNLALKSGFQQSVNQVVDLPGDWNLIEDEARREYQRDLQQEWLYVFDKTENWDEIDRAKTPHMRINIK